MSNTNLQGAHDFVLNNPQFNQTLNATAGSGIKKLLKASMPEAFHDSGARDPPRCHPGTRLDYIDQISSWGSGTSQHPQHILWMQGAAGVGKSAIAQSCAELLAKRNQLGAAFFFSRPNQRDDPTRLFTSISYQIATKSTSFSNILDRDIRNDPTLLEKSLPQQFHELLVKPLRGMREVKKDLKGYMIIIDGLDECAGIEAQREIAKIVAKSVQDATTPFRWAFFSRPESHIIASFTSDRVRPLCLHLELPVSRDSDHEILCYLTSKLEKIREEHGLPSSWPSERDLGTLVDRSAGLFIYASTVVRFVGERNSSGPIDQLRLVLLLTKQAASNAGLSNPLSELDLFYTLILRCVPSKILPTIQKILLLYDTAPRYPDPSYYTKIHAVANSLGLSEMQVRNACAALRSVLRLGFMYIEFYHASFMDFLRDPDRSKEFCIYKDCLDTARQALLERLSRVHTPSIGRLTFNLTWSPSPQGQPNLTWSPGPKADLDLTYRYLVNTFFLLCSHPRPLLPSTAAGLVKFQFAALLHLYQGPTSGGSEIVPEALRQNIPTELRNKVIRRSYNPAVYFYKPRDAERDWPYVVGQGKNKVVWWAHPTRAPKPTGRKSDSSEFASYPSELAPYPSIFKFLSARTKVFI